MSSIKALKRSPAGTLYSMDFNTEGMYYLLNAKDGKLSLSIDARKPHKLKLMSYSQDIDIEDASKFLDKLIEGPCDGGAYVDIGYSIEKEILMNMGFKVVSGTDNMLDYMERRVSHDL